MCGILAVIDDRGAFAAHEERRFDAALDLLKHRGPDDRGVWSDGHAWLGHRRLAIIDLSSAGHQPMADAETGVTITFNGEIYNYLELREELRLLGYRFASHSDTEVLLRAYLAWGQECLRRLNGMWHFVIWDPRNRTAFIARDRLGVKPSYYSLDGGRLIVASEPKAILAIEPTHRCVDRSALRDFLVSSALYSSNRSFYEGVCILSPAHHATFDAATGNFAVRRYWAPPSEGTEPGAWDLEQFAELIADSVRLRMRSDVPVGLTLSGGLDSTTILTEAIKHTARLIAFTSVYRSALPELNIDEEQWARVAVAPFANVDLQAVNAAPEHWIETLRQIAWHMDGPADSPAVFPLWQIMERARSAGVPVLLEGQGADELLGGYVQYAALDGLDVLSKAMRQPFPAQWIAVARTLASYAQTFSPTRLGLSMVRAQFPGLLPTYRRRFGTLGTLRQEFLSVDQDATRGPVDGSRVHTRLLNDLQYDTLPGLLQYGDAISMAHSIESRLPFLDYRLVELCVSLPMSAKVANGQTKRALRALLHRAGLHQIAKRRDKKGYPTPVGTWLAARNGELARHVLLSPNARIHEFCEPRGLARLIDMHVRGINALTGFHLYRLVSTELWLHQCMTAGSEVAFDIPASRRSNALAGQYSG
jgi:asparagine synthase (glutamine-hydrolysing)